MLNISENSIQDQVNMEQYRSNQKTKIASANRMLSWWLLITLIIFVVFVFLPWRQNIQMKGEVTTLKPEQRPQTIHSAIAGRIENWYVREGEKVHKGDTILFLSEVKAEYFDPNLVERTANQVAAKESAIQTYSNKANALQNQISALRREQIQKREQLKNKIKQSEAKLESAKANAAQAKVDYNVAEYQYRRTDTLYQKGIKSLTDLEGKRLKLQETSAKLVSANNKVVESENDLSIANLEFGNVDNEYANKIAKAESDRFSALSNQYDAEGSLNKLSNELSNYQLRNNMYYVIAPQDCYITQVVKPGIGEIVKEGEPILSIVPTDYELAVALYVKPMDMPLMELGQNVRFIFDGWPAFIFSGWPDMSFGTYSGEIIAIDNIPDKDLEYRVLVSANDKKPWPKALRVGSGAEGIALLKRVPVWYEIWRRLNGFPPDFYEKSPAKEDNKFKPPVRAVAK